MAKTQATPEQRLERIQKGIDRLRNKDFTFFFYIVDTNGNATSSIAQIYEHAMSLHIRGYKVCMLYDPRTKDGKYSGVKSWLGEEYDSLPHKSIKDESLKISGLDFVVIPELFTNVLSAFKNLPSRQIVFAQGYESILEFLGYSEDTQGKKSMQYGVNWNSYNVWKAVCTSNKMKSYINRLFPGVDTHVIEPYISDHFTPTEKMQTPAVAIHTRNQRDATNLIKAFYLQYPDMKWVGFKELIGLSVKDFADELKQCCMAVWIDEVSSFGTFPIEAMKCKVPVLAKIPNTTPEWMEEKDENGQVNLKQNGVWMYDKLLIPDQVANFVQAWMEDRIPEKLYEPYNEMKDKYTKENLHENVEKTFMKFVMDRLAELQQAYKNVLAEKENLIESA